MFGAGRGIGIGIDEAKKPIPMPIATPTPKGCIRHIFVRHRVRYEAREGLLPK